MLKFLKHIFYQRKKIVKENEASFQKYSQIFYFQNEILKMK
jgi:hypothetical protein